MASATVKWGKQRFTGVWLYPGEASDALMQRLCDITGVPIERQKIMCPGAWQGILKRKTTLDRDLAHPPGQKEFTIMLVGSAASAPVAPPPQPEEEEGAEALREALEIAEGDSEAAECDIVALQKTPGERGGVTAGEVTVKYSHFVHGLPQCKIEDALRVRRGRGGALLGDCCAMTLGMELGASYVSVLACLADGSLVSGLDNGRLQLWRRCERVREMMHDSQGAVACVATVSNGSTGTAFATGGFGSVKLWTAEGECVQTVAAPVGTTPRSMVACGKILAVVFGQARAFNPHAFRLVPQNEEQRRRRAAAEAAQAEAEAAFDIVVRSVQLVELHQGICVRSSFLGPLESPVCALAAWPLSEGLSSQLACGDARGGLHLWSVTGGRGAGEAAVARRAAGLQLALADPSVGVSVVCLEVAAAQDHLLAISVEATSTGAVRGDGVNCVWLPASRGVALIDVARRQVRAFIDAHTDVVHCMCATPDGLVTGGGKMDARVLMWHALLWQQPAAVAGEAEGATVGEAPGKAGADDNPVLLLTEASQALKEPGYVFRLAVLPDSTAGSNCYALAGARYNTVKICL